MQTTNKKTSEPNGKNNQIFVLAIAIDEYKSEHISDLQACVKDVYRLKDIFQKQYDIPDENYLVLENEQATRTNIINAFRTHFSKLKKGDIAVLNYSGHGSWEDGSLEFAEAGLEQTGTRNELLVVHNYGDEGILNIADKELRWLISELQYTKKQVSKDIHFVALMDCCHSGSLLRNQEKRNRLTLTSSNQARSLKDYLEGQYQTMYDDTGTMEFPKANFILFSACSPTEYALEVKEGGLFSQALADALERTSNTPPTYANLHTHIKNILEVKSKDTQHPYLEYEGNVNPFQVFLSRQLKEADTLPPLKKKGEEWMTPIGAIHGICESSWKKHEIALYAADNLQEIIGTAKLEEVGIEACSLKPNFFNDTNIDDIAVGIYGSTLEISIQVENGIQEMKNQLFQKLKQVGLWHQIRITENARYQLQITSAGISIYKVNQLITGGTWNIDSDDIEKEQDTIIAFIASTLQKVIRWEQINQLQAPKASIITNEHIGLGFTHWDDQNKVNAHKTIVSPPSSETNSMNEITIPFKQEARYIPFCFDISNHGYNPYYFYLVHLDRKYGIAQKLPVFNKALKYEENYSFDSLQNDTAFAITNPNLERTTDVFIVFASKDSLDAPHLFSQKGLGDFFGIINSIEELQTYRDTINMKTINQSARWQMQKFKVHLVRG